MRCVSLAAVLAVACGSVAVAQPGSAPAIEKERISDQGGVLKTTEVLKSGKHLETISCRSFNALDASFKPQAVTYAANYGPHGRAHPTDTVSGMERIVPVVVTNCQARPGDRLVDKVHSAMMAHKG